MDIWSTLRAAMADAAKNYASADGEPVSHLHIMAAHGLLSNALRQEFDAAMARGYIEAETVEETSASAIFPAMPPILPPSSDPTDSPAKDGAAKMDQQPTDVAATVITESETASTEIETVTDSTAAPVQAEEEATNA